MIEKKSFTTVELKIIKDGGLESCLQTISCTGVSRK